MAAIGTIQKDYEKQLKQVHLPTDKENITVHVCSVQRTSI